MSQVELRQYNAALSNQNPIPLLHQTPSVPRVAKQAPIEKDVTESASFPMPDDPKVIFFPSNQDSSGANTCQDKISTKSEMGFNTFAFLSFALTIFNVMR